MQNPIPAEWLIISVTAPGKPTEPAGILVRDCRADQLYLKLKPELSMQDEDIRLVWEQMEDELQSRAREMGAVHLFDWLQSTAANAIQVSELHKIDIEVDNLPDLLLQLFNQHVRSSDSVFTASNPA